MVTLPEPNSYPRKTLDAVEVCVYCERPESVINGNVDRHILGCHFRSRWHAIWHWLKQQAIDASILRINTINDKIDNNIL